MVNNTASIVLYCFSTLLFCSKAQAAKQSTILIGSHEYLLFSCNRG